MADLTFTKDLESNSPINSVSVREHTLELIKAKFEAFKVTKDGFKCRVKTKLFNPIVSIKGRVDCKTSGTKGKVLIEGKVVTNLWFWFTFLVGFTCPPLFLLMFWMYSSQKKKSSEAFKEALAHLNFDIWKSEGTAAATNLDAVAKLHELRKQGALTEEEYQREKARLIA